MRLFLTWLNVLSLDAPLVAVAWQALFAKVAGMHLRLEHRVILFASVWLGYAADRWLDAGRDHAGLSERHQWYDRRRSAVLVVWLTVLSGAIGLSVATLSQQNLALGVALTIAAIGYTVFAQYGRPLPVFGIVKCFGIGALVATSSALFAFDWSSPAAFQLQALALVASLFFLNCLFIRHWSGDRSIGRRLLWVATAFVTTILLLATTSSMLRSTALTALASLLILGGVHFSRNSLGLDLARSAADLALLTPLVFLLL